MAVKTHHEARCLFVQSQSYGDIVLTKILLAGQEFSRHSAVMLAERLFSTNRNLLPGATYRYASAAEIVGFVDEWKPDLVFFVSAYGLVVNGLLPLASVEDLVQQLRDRGCRLVTTDPFIGSSRKLSLWKVDLPFRRLPLRVLLRELSTIRRGFRDFARLDRCLENWTYLYPVPINGLFYRDRVRRVSFFNPNIVRPASEFGPCAGVECGLVDSNTPARCWLFVIGATDVGCQNLLWGKKHFARLVAEKLEQAREQRRTPVLIAPRPLIDAVSKLPGGTQAELLEFCSYAHFVSRLLDAEYVFYWNVLSCSVLLRIVNSLPVFFFDEGHVERLLKPSYEIGVRCVYAGWTPRILDVQNRLDADLLAELATDQRRVVVQILAQWRQSPPPGEVIDQLLHDPPVAPWS